MIAAGYYSELLKGVAILGHYLAGHKIAQAGIQS